MSLGWSGQILRVDLSKMESSTEDVEPYTRSFIGGRGINVKIMYDDLDPKISPFEPGNRLCFGPGVLAGTLAPASSRMKVTTMSPNGLIQNSGIGSFIGKEIRHAGYDNIVIQGKSDKPVYLYINDDSVEIKDATHLWGKATWETQQTIKEELGNSVQTMCIGTAGENLVSFGNIITGNTSAAGRGGMGAIMGSKNLKAIAVRGTRGVKIAKLEEFTAECEKAHKWLKENERAKSMVFMGDTGVVQDDLDLGMFITGNYEVDTKWDEFCRFDGGLEFWDKYEVHKYECFGCPIGHSALFNVPGIGTGSSDCVGWISFGGQVWNNDREVTFHANYLCDVYGLDCVSTGNITSFLMELYHRGIITEKDTDGIAMKRGDRNAIISTIHKIGKQEGFGKLFKDGVLQAARAIGRGAEDCAMQVKGLEMYPREPRSFKSFGLGAAVATRDVIEDLTFMDFCWAGEKEEMEKWSQEYYGSKDAAIPNTYEKKPLAVWDYGNRCLVSDMLGVCRWVIPWFVTPSLETPAKLFSLATGRDTSEDELLTAAQRVRVLERAFNVLKGIRRKDDTLPKRMFEQVIQDGIFKGETLDRQKFEEMIDEYYKLRGWDEDGIPTQDTFKRFGLTSEWGSFRKKIGKERVSHG